MTDLPASTGSIRPQDWALKPAFGWKSVAVVILIVFGLSVSAHRMHLDTLLGSWLHQATGQAESARTGQGLSDVLGQMVPVAIAERTPVDLIQDFDPGHLPFLSHLETVRLEETHLNPDTLEMETELTERTYLVEPAGYLAFVLGKMVETVEMGIWASLLAVLVSLPLAWLAAKNYAPSVAIYALTRSIVSFLRAIPELVSALFLVLAFGFGPVAGIAALALHSIGFLAKFYAEDVEAADEAPQEALRATGAGRFSVLRLAVLPQVLPSFTALSFYILDRNIRMATVIGLVGAGGIGQELKGRFDMFQYDRVGTILLIIFLAVLILDQIAARLRARLI